MTNHETAKHLRDAQRRLRSVLIANADRLSTPFTDDPSKNPWDTYLRPAVRGLQEAVSAACDALAAPAAVSVPPPAPRADDRAAVLRWAADWFDSGIRSVSRMFGHQAAAELRRMADEATPVAAPSPPANEPGPAVAVSRPDVLRWAAELVAADTAHIRYGSATDYANRHAALLRRAADDAQGPCVAGEQQNETPDEALPFIHVDDDSDQLEIGAVMASTYDGEAPVVYVATEQHQGDQVATVYVRPERVEQVVAALRSARRAAETLPAVVAQPGKEHGRG